MRGDVKVRGRGINGRGWQTYQAGRVRIAPDASRAGDGERVWWEIGTSFEVVTEMGVCWKATRKVQVRMDSIGTLEVMECDGSDNMDTV